MTRGVHIISFSIIWWWKLFSPPPIVISPNAWTLAVVISLKAVFSVWRILTVSLTCSSPPTTSTHALSVMGVPASASPAVCHVLMI